ncbi:MAG: hypothetical protein LBC47_04620 [Tannerella sp.]|jgi:hypothetical protein|nr:hypothetical protein [Tannerella sp.]
MTVKSDILRYASSNKVFTKRKLTDCLAGNPAKPVAARSVSQELDNLVRANTLTRIQRGIYTVTKNSKPEFFYPVSTVLTQLNAQIKAQFPFASICMWDSAVFPPLMHHIPMLNYIYADAERDAMDAVFNFLKDSLGANVFLKPDRKVYDRYIAGTKAIIVRQLISESPLQTVDGILTPKIEKILVDIAGDTEFDFLQGTEIYRVYKNVIEKFNINKTKMLRYASRRNRRKIVERLYSESI